MTAGAARTDVLRRAPRVRDRLVPSAAVLRAGSPSAEVLRAGSAAAPAELLRAGSASATNAGPSPSAAAAAGLSVRIDRLVIDGPRLDPRQSAQLRTALELELGALLQGEPLHPCAKSHDRLRGPSLSAAASGPAGLGRAIARSLHAGLAAPGLINE